MSLKTFLTLITCLCLHTVTAIGEEPVKLQPAPEANFTAVGGSPRDITLGSLDPNTGFKFLIELTSRGAAISKATLSEFDDRNIKNRQQLVLLATANRPDGTQAFSMANEAFVLADKQLKLRLDKLDWTSLDVKKGDGSETAIFEAIIKDKATGKPAIKLTKTYSVTKGGYDVNCDLTIENLSSDEHKVQIDMAGPLGIQNEDPRADTRRIVSGFRDIQGEVVSNAFDIKKLTKAKTPEQRQLSIKNAGFLWASVTNKYFAAILIPTPEPNTNFCNWLTDKLGWFANSVDISTSDIGQGNIGIDLKTTTFTFAEAGKPQSSKKLEFRLFLGPKDNTLFKKIQLYQSLGFIHTIDFMACCCPGAIIYPLGFGILALMNWLHGFWPYNYGIVIIILVLLVRLILHPLTRKSQVSMSEFAKFNALPEVLEIRKTYAKDMMEMNRRISEVQKKHGVSHSAMLMGMLPMLVQMPIWIALYGAIYASIDLRGAGFLPFWITDLSAPDALFRFTAFNVPLFGRIDSFNLLPILMGIAFYLQQKLTPTQAAATPEAAQQQKMMMIMMPVLFPLMLYTSPSGLNLYIMASTFGGVLEQYVIKKHIREKEELKEQGLVAVTSKTGGKVKKQKPKPFFKI
jgi:YidC/Oxa1 family membrane protein insertase